MYDTYDCDITIYNAQYDRKVGDRVWRRMQISGASFYGGQQVTVSDSGLSTADEYTVRIPMGSMPDGFVAVSYTHLSFSIYARQCDEEVRTNERKSDRRPVKPGV